MQWWRIAPLFESSKNKVSTVPLISVVPKVTGTNCEADDAVDKGFGESFITAEESANEMEKELDVNIGYKVCVRIWTKIQYVL